MTKPAIRDEQAQDFAAIRAITLAAFENMPYSSQTEAAIIEALRAADALVVSLVAVEGGEIVGHVAFSPITINEAATPGWFGVGPLSVRPDRQRCGIGSALMRAGLERIRAMDAKGCVLAGDPAYYRRFGFEAKPSLTLPLVPPQNFLILALSGPQPSGTVAFHPGFGARD